MSPVIRSTAPSAGAPLSGPKRGIRLLAVGQLTWAAAKALGSGPDTTAAVDVLFPPTWETWAVRPVAPVAAVQDVPGLLPLVRRAEVALTLVPPGPLAVGVDLGAMGYASVRVANAPVKTPSSGSPAPSGTAVPDLGDTEIERDMRYASMPRRGIARAGVPRPQDFGAGMVGFSLQTSGEVLTSQETAVVASAGVSGPEFRFRITFETDEVPSPGGFFDSITVGLRGGSGPTATLATVDAFGITPAPSTPGGMFLDAAAVTYESTPVGPGSLLAGGQNYDVTVVLPAGLAGPGVLLVVTLDFFDNQNGIASKATIQVPTAVPEPGQVGLLLTGLAVLSWTRRGKT